MSNNKAPWHFGMKYSGQTLKWLPSDSEENFQRLIQEEHHREYFLKQGWLEPEAITYKINSDGFRSDEFDASKDSIVALGCSYSVGIGLPLSDIWPTLVGKQLNLAVYNLAWGGNSADTCYRLAEYWIPKLQPKIVVMLTPPRNRLELLTTNSTNPIEVFLPAVELGLFEENDTFLKYWFTNEENAYLNSRKNCRAVKHLCNELNIKCQIYDAHTFMARSREEVGYARDYMHAGPIGHRLVFEKVMSDYGQ